MGILGSSIVGFPALLHSDDFALWSAVVLLSCGAPHVHMLCNAVLINARSNQLGLVVILTIVVARCRQVHLLHLYLLHLPQGLAPCHRQASWAHHI